MKVLTYGEIMDGGLSVFHSVAKLDDRHLILTFEGVIRVDNPYRYLHTYLEELAKVLPKQKVTDTTMDFVKLRFCNSNGFYVIMDIVDAGKTTKEQLGLLMAGIHPSDSKKTK